MGAKKGRFIMGFHAERPAQNARTEQKGYERHLYEEVEYTEKLRKNDMDTATYILNIDEMKFEKNRVDNFTVEICLQHLQKHFPQQYPIWFNKVEAETQKDKDNGE
jgi:hypothetical protein